LKEQKTYLKVVDALIRVHLSPSGSEAVSRQLLNLWQNIAFKANVEFCKVLVKVSLKVQVAELVSCLKLPVVLCFLLDSIVCEMDELVGKVAHIEFAARGAKVAFFVEVSFVIAIHRSYHGVGPDVKLASIYQKRIVDVLLDNACTLLGLCVLSYQILDFGEIFGYLDALSPVGIFAWLDDPDVLFVDVCLVVSLEFEKLGVIEAFFDVERHWQCIKGVLAYSFVVVAHVDPESLLIRKVIVVLNLVIQLVRIHFRAGGLLVLWLLAALVGWL